MQPLGAHLVATEYPEYSEPYENGAEGAELRRPFVISRSDTRFVERVDGVHGILNLSQSCAAGGKKSGIWCIVGAIRLVKKVYATCAHVSILTNKEDV